MALSTVVDQMMRKSSRSPSGADIHAGALAHDLRYRFWISLALYSWSVAVSALVLVMISSMFLSPFLTFSLDIVLFLYSETQRQALSSYACELGMLAKALRWALDHLFGAAARGAGQLEGIPCPPPPSGRTLALGRLSRKNLLQLRSSWA